MSYGLLIVAAPLSVAGRLDGLADKFVDWFRRTFCSLKTICHTQVALEDIVAYLMAGAPVEILLGELCSTFSLGSAFILLSFQLAWWLCDITAGVPCSSKLVDYAVTFLICLGWFVFSILGFIIDRFTSKSNLWGGIAWVCVNFLLVCYGSGFLCRRPQR